MLPDAHSSMFTLSNLYFILVLAIISILSTVYPSYMCVLRMRHDVSTGTERWSLPSEERCHCTAVLAPKFMNANCSTGPREIGMILWFVDNPKPLTNRSNWNAEMLNKLLERSEFCGTLIIIYE